MIWYSQRDDWGHLYLYDLGDREAEEPDHDGRGAGHADREGGREGAHGLVRGAWAARRAQDPYFRHLYRVGLDGRNYVSLTPDAGRSQRAAVALGQVHRRHLLDVRDAARRSSLRDGDGKFVMPLEKADISKLLATGWKPPDRHHGEGARRQDRHLRHDVPCRPSSTRAASTRSSTTPTRARRSGSVGSRSFAAARGDQQALAELGFVVVSIDGMGTPGRSKSFQDAYYGAMGRDNTLPDQVAGMKELAQKYPWIDIDRAAIWGHSGGGFVDGRRDVPLPGLLQGRASPSRAITISALNEDDWGERYQGLLDEAPTASDSYDAEANQDVREEPEGPPAARARHDGQQRAALQHAARRGRADQGEQGLRPADAAEPEPRLRRGVATT